MSRRGKEFSAKTKAQAFMRSDGSCEVCGLKLRVGVEYDHRIPIADGGDGSLSNCVVTCRHCHSAKTKKDVTRIAKGKRIHRKHVNAVTAKRAIPSRGFPKVEKERKRWPGPNA